jgi:putative DNA primase/helicase
MDWRQSGMQIPEKVQFATREYRQEQDVLGRFVDERCTKAGNASVKFADLYRNLELWGEENGEDIPDKKSTGQWLDKQGFTTKRGAKGARLRLGIDLAWVTGDAGDRNCTIAS